MATPRTNKSTIKNDPFESVIPMYQPAERKEVRPRTSPKPSSVPKPVPPTVEAPKTPLVTSAPMIQSAMPSEGRQKLTVHLDADVVNRVKNAAYWNPRLTIAKIAERGIRYALKEVEKENGGPYLQREGELVGGRPIK